MALADAASIGSVAAVSLTSLTMGLDTDPPKGNPNNSPWFGLEIYAGSSSDNNKITPETSM